MNLLVFSSVLFDYYMGKEDLGCAPRCRLEDDLPISHSCNQCLEMAYKQKLKDIKTAIEAGKTEFYF